jgi:MFS transporter, CP family, cyanate transporter
MLRSLCLLWLAGLATRVTVLAVPPVLPLMRNDLGMSETQVGLLIGLPLATWALAAVPGSLFVAKWGALRTVLIGLLLTAVAGALRAAAGSVSPLYVFTLLMGFGIAIMQPSNARLLREWLSQKLGLGSAVSTNGLLMGCTLGPLLTAPLIMPLLGQSWRFDLLFWSAPVLVTALLFIAFAPVSPKPTGDAAFTRAGWWPEWKSAPIWFLGITFGCNNAAFYGTNGFLPDYLASIDRGELIGPALACLNGSQVVTSALLLVLAERLQGRVWPFFIFGLAPLIGIVGILAGTSAAALVVSAIIIGACLAVTFVITMVLMLLLSPPEDVHRITAGMFTIAYALALALPVLCGALWDLTGLPWAAFVPVGICSLVVTFIGAAMTRSRITKSSAGRYRSRV